MKKFTLLLCSCLIATAMQAQILRVPADYPTIQSAVDAAGYGDTVLVSQRPLNPYTENIVIEGNHKVITLASEFLISNNEEDIINTVINAGYPQNPNRGMGILIKNQDSIGNTRVIGFTITGGTGYYKTYGGGIYISNAAPVIEFNHIRNCGVIGTQPSGGGIYAGYCSDTTRTCFIMNNIIENCTISSNLYGGGVGIALSGGNYTVENNTIKNNVFSGPDNGTGFGTGLDFTASAGYLHPVVSISNNIIANNAGTCGLISGGGIALSGEGTMISPDFIIEGNLISGNSIHSTVGTPDLHYAVGGGIVVYAPGENLVISGNVISGNSVQDCERYIAGGGIALFRSINPVPENPPLIEMNKITENYAGHGGGIYSELLQLKLVNNLISGNVAEYKAGAAYIYGPFDATRVTGIINNTINYNVADTIGGIFIEGDLSALLMNNIIYDNQADTIDDLKIWKATVEIHHCDVKTDEIIGPWGGEGNINEPPLFKEDSLHMSQEGNPCFDAGIEYVIFHEGWYYCPNTDIDNNERPFPDPNCTMPEIGADEIDWICVGVDESSVVSQQSLVTVFPNPTTGTTQFLLSNFQFQRAILKILDVNGREVATVLDGTWSGGQVVSWDASGLPAGVYFYKLAVDSRQLAVGKMVKY